MDWWTGILTYVALVLGVPLLVAFALGFVDGVRLAWATMRRSRRRA